MEVYKKKLGCIFRYTRFEVRHEPIIKFWQDIWCGDRVLKEVYLEIFGIVRMQQALIADLVDLSNGVFQWKITFSRDTQDWEVDDFLEFYHLVYYIQMRGGS